MLKKPQKHTHKKNNTPTHPPTQINTQTTHKKSQQNPQPKNPDKTNNPAAQPHRVKGKENQKNLLLCSCAVVGQTGLLSGTAGLGQVWVPDTET